MKTHHFVLLALTLVSAACEEESELECTTDSDCGDIAVCVERVCVAPAAILECTESCSTSEVCYGGECLSAMDACNACVERECLWEADRCSNTAGCSDVAGCVSECHGAEACSRACAVGRTHGARATSALYGCMEGCEGCAKLEFTNPFAGESLESSDAERFVQRLDGTIEDTDTALVWERFPGEAKLWAAAAEYCAELELGGQSDWRMPTFDELLTILNSEEGTGGEYTGGCYWNSVFGGDCRSNRYWSSSEDTDDEVNVVGFYLGTPNTNAKSDDAYVRCVRGQPRSSDDDRADPNGGVQFKFCNTLTVDDQDVEAYYDVNGGGVTERLTANTLECSPCVTVEAGATVEFEFGIGSNALTTGSWETEAGKHYLVGAELDDDGSATTVVYEIVESERENGYHCSNLDPFEDS